MNLDLKDVVGLLANVLVGIAAVIGGMWALLCYRRERMDQTAIDITTTISCIQHGETHLVFLDVCITNKGRTKWQIKTKKDSNGFVYGNRDQLRHGLSLRLKKIVVQKETKDRQIDWYDEAGVQPIPDLEEINLASHYAFPADPDREHFWMEPSESYHFGISLMLLDGLYLAKVTCVGVGGEQEYWTRTVVIEVPKAMES